MYIPLDADVATSTRPKARTENENQSDSDEMSEFSNYIAANSFNSSDTDSDSLPSNKKRSTRRKLSGNKQNANIVEVEKHLPCSLCEKKFSTIRNLKRHLRRHSGPNMHCCGWCEQKFETNSGRLAHQKEVHSETKRELKCPHCGKICSSPSKFKRHMLTHANGRPTLVVEKHLPCSLCEKTFSTIRNLNKHIRRHSGPNMHCCRWCEQKFETYSERLAHQKEVHKGTKRELKCPHCRTICNNPSKLKRHMLTHTKERPFICPTCGNGFTQRSTLRNHERAVHIKEKSNLCDQCGKGFSDHSSYLRHVRVTHSGKKPLPFSCSYCKNSYATRDYLKSHEKCHTGEKPYKCRVCRRAFSQYSSLRSHEKCVHKPVQSYSRSTNETDLIVGDAIVEDEEKEDPVNCSLCFSEACYTGRNILLTKSLLNQFVSKSEKSLFHPLKLFNFCVHCAETVEDLRILQDKFDKVKQKLKVKSNELKYRILKCGVNVVQEQRGDNDKVFETFRKICTRDFCPRVQINKNNELYKGNYIQGKSQRSISKVFPPSYKYKCPPKSSTNNRRAPYSDNERKPTKLSQTPKSKSLIDVNGEDVLIKIEPRSVEDIVEVEIYNVDSVSECISDIHSETETDSESRNDLFDGEFSPKVGIKVHDMNHKNEFKKNITRPTGPAKGYTKTLKDKAKTRKQYLDIHKAPKGLSCSMCAKSFNSRSSLMIHQVKICEKDPAKANAMSCLWKSPGQFPSVQLSEK